MKNILVIGATGQIGSELTLELRKRYGGDHVRRLKLWHDSLRLIRFTIWPLYYRWLLRVGRPWLGKLVLMDCGMYWK